ncbi:NrdH-redoxin [Candidatus Velamenicoccus archaeovorus]|uniref:NrdH-redoxin n=1 Tax=Velamenicoccus archaeovorus TaxID=1930593 RepID=A0A410P2S3_VELA1|nr:Uxx-star family glutaredoxin-like (seleno)protein [Candidatus Velamenicoccus archaeovorus]QAT16324.1 NrdH-redoxin [Candidatus Velamenicoccus archaeovorus]
MVRVKVYSTPTCPYCIRAKKYLSDKGVDFENIDVSADEEALKQMVDVSGQMGVPVLVIDGEVIVGFDQARIDQKLGL